jgi:hypothetical protein
MLLQTLPDLKEFLRPKRLLSRTLLPVLILLCELGMPSYESSIFRLAHTS